MAKILLLEDNGHVADGLVSVLKQLGHSAYATYSVYDALDRAKMNVDLVITDLSINEEEGIIPLLDYLKREKPFVPVIIYAGAELDGRHTRKDLYCHAFCSKRSRMNKLLEKIDEFIENPPMDRKI